MHFKLCARAARLVTMLKNLCDVITVPAKYEQTLEHYQPWHFQKNTFIKTSLAFPPRIKISTFIIRVIRL
ncbi:MAG TPA: hypothetical protein DGG95_12810 [Cytophagales bacterium]|nr:hypothetical protein [Cytophagales bacterium]